MSSTVKPFWSPWNHEKAFRYLRFSGGSKGNIGEKRVKGGIQDNSLKNNLGTH